jgi:hypothetical protein
MKSQYIIFLSCYKSDAGEKKNSFNFLMHCRFFLAEFIDITKHVGILSYQNSNVHQGRIIKIAYSNKCKSLLQKTVVLYAQF